MSPYTKNITGGNSGKIVPFVILIILPLSLTILVFVGPRIVLGISDVYFFVALAFGLYSLRYSTSKYFKKKGYKKGVVEYEFTRKITYLLVLILILVLTYNLINAHPSLAGVRNSYFFFLKLDPLYPVGLLNAIWMFALIGGLIWIGIQSRKKEFEFYFAKALVKIALEESDETRKVNYFIKCVKFYDRYLRRNLNLQINDTKEIYSKIIIDTNISKNDQIKSLFLAFETDNDRLKPVKCLSEIGNLDDTKKFLTEELIVKRLRDLAIFFATMIPVAIAIIQLFSPKGGG